MGGRRRVLPIPIIFNLREFRASTSLQQLITDTLLNRYGVDLKSFRAFERMCAGGRVVIILDGFDEMTERSDRKTIVDAFHQVYLLAALDAKVILTCRSKFFRSHADLVSLLENFSIALTAPPDAEPLRISFERLASVVTVERLGREQIRRFVERRFPDDVDEILATIDSIHDLTDLSTRPVLLDMILTTLPALAERKKKVNSAALYEHYTDRWTRRDDWRVVTPLETRQEFANTLAWLMHSSGLQEIDSIALGRLLVETIGAVTRSAEDLELFKNDIQTCSFLVRAAAGGTFRFAHRSFLEFFVARKLIHMLGAGRLPDRVELAKHVVPMSDPTEEAPVTTHLAREFEALRLHLSETLARTKGYRHAVHLQVVAHEPLLISYTGWQPMFEERLKACFVGLGFEVPEKRLELSEEIATFALEYLHNIGVPLGQFVASLPGEAGAPTFADLVRLSRSVAPVLANAPFVREFVTAAGHAGLKAALAAALARGGFAFEEPYVRDLRAGMTHTAWIYFLFTAATEKRLAILRTVLSWDVTSAIERFVAVLGLTCAGESMASPNTPGELASELTRAGNESEELLALLTTQSLALRDSDVTLMVACAFAASGSDKVRREAVAVLENLEGEDAWRRLRARAAAEGNPATRRLLARAEQRLRDMASAQKGRAAWDQSKHEKSVREKLWRLL